MKLTQEYTADIEHRFKYAAIAVAVLFFVVAGRLYYLQVIKGAFYHFFSTENSIKAIKVPAPRGMIFDRRGRVLVDNRPAFNIIITPQYVVDPPKTLESVHVLLGIPRGNLEAIWEQRKQQPRYRPLVLKADASYDEAALIHACKNPWYDHQDPFDLRGVDVEVLYQRSYPESNIATHVLGYVREIDAQRLDRYEKEHPGRYHLGDRVGIRGLEERWDLMLRGRDGYEERVVNAVGREVDYEGIASQLEQRPAVPGSNLVLTIDQDLQRVAREMFGGRKGAAVAIDPRDGAILTMYSSPSYDLNQLASPEGSDYWLQISSDPAHYLLNRATQGGYPPGSTYKLVTAAAALAEGVVSPTERVPCWGQLNYRGRAYHCWRAGGHGFIDLHRAIVSSCDVYFYTLGLRLGVDRLAKYARLFGFGQKTGVPLPGERAGIIPTSEWKLQRLGQPWQKGETLSVAVGQAYDVVTPLQNALLAAQLANGGKRLELHFVNAILDFNGEKTYQWEPPEDLEPVPVDPKIIQMLKEAMAGVVSEPGGTAHRLSSYKIPMGGKTGTAQVVRLDRGAECHSEICKDHSWFIGFAPVESPSIAAAVVVEHGGFGSEAAAPIVGALLQKGYAISHGT